MQGVLGTTRYYALGLWAGLDGRSRVLYGSISASLVLHALVLAVHFKFPESLRWKNESPPLEVILVNAKTKERPVKAEALAQANLDRGGDRDDKRRARSPLPVAPPPAPSNEVAAAQRRVAELEAKQEALLAKAKDAAPQVSEARTPREEPAPQPSGRELADLALTAMRLQAQLDKRLEEYAKRPRKQFIGARAAEYRFAQYEEDWRQKVERIGTLNYPPEARGKLYGNLRMTVTIRPDGAVESIELDRSSGLKVLDAAAFKIVRMASPFAPFPTDIRRDTDLLVITRTWFFGQGDQMWME